MRVIAVLILCCTLLACAPATPPEAEESSYREDVARLVRISMTDRLKTKIAQSYRQQISAILSADPSAPEAAYRILDEEIEVALDRMMNDLVVGLTPIYTRHFDHEEIRQLLDFYQSDIGRKSMEVSAEMAGTGRVIVKDWSRDFGQVLFNRLEKRMGEEGIPF